MIIPHPSWETAKFNIGQKIQFKDSVDFVRDAVVTGWDTQDRVIAEYRNDHGILHKDQSIHISRILPVKHSMIKFYQVGGSVRDKLLGIPSKDIDYAVEAPSFDSMRQAILDRGGKIFLETPKYFTIRALVPTLGATDYTLCRKDGEYVDGRHPETVEIGTIQDDLARRDFTINAMAIDTDTGILLDPHNGQRDIQHKLIRCVGQTSHRMQEDALRALRAIRFNVTKTNFVLEMELFSYIQKMRLDDFRNVSTERIRDELFKMFAANTFKSIYILQSFPVIVSLIKERGIWFEPTTKQI